MQTCCSQVIRPVEMVLLGWDADMLRSLGLSGSQLENKYVPALVAIFTEALATSQDSFNVIVQQARVVRNASTSVEEFDQQKALAEKTLKEMQKKHNDGGGGEEKDLHLVVKSITAKTPPAGRRLILDEFNSKKAGRVMLLNVCGCVGPGVNTFADCYISTAPASSEGDAIQMFGRLQRNYEAGLPPSKALLPVRVPLQKLEKIKDKFERSRELVQEIMAAGDWTVTLRAIAVLHNDATPEIIFDDIIYAKAENSGAVIKSPDRLQRELAQSVWLGAGCHRGHPQKQKTKTKYNYA